MSSEILMNEVLTEVVALRLAPDMDDLISGDDPRLSRAIAGVRDQLVRDLGLLLPPVPTRVDPTIPDGEYAVMIDGSLVGRGSAPVDSVLVLGGDLDGLDGRPVVEPVFGVDAVWVDEATCDDDAITVGRIEAITAHLTSLFRIHAPHLLTRDAVADMVTVLRERHPAACEEIEAGVLPLAVLHGLLRDLLAEGKSIRHLRRILDEVGCLLASGATYTELLGAARRGTVH